MHRSLIASLLWFFLVSSARATSVEIPVSRTNLETHFHTFLVSTKASKDDIAFQVTITSKRSDVYPDSEVYVGKVIHKKLNNGKPVESSIGPAEPTIPVALKKENRVWTADFAVSRKLLKNPELHFVFSVLAHSTVNGKTIPMPSITFYELRLQEFAKP